MTQHDVLRGHQRKVARFSIMTLITSTRSQRCEHCESSDVRWFTPPSASARAAVLLCMACERLTIVPPRPRGRTPSEAIAA